METRIASEMVGLVNPHTVGAAAHPITVEEHQLAVEIGYEMAARYGIDLAAHVAAQYEYVNDPYLRRIRDQGGAEITQGLPTKF